MSRLVIPQTAFAATSRRTKRRRSDGGDFLAFLRTLPCLVTGSYNSVQAAHVNYADLRYGKLGRGKSQKDDDSWAVPLSEKEHAYQHAFGDEERYWKSVGIDPVRVAISLWRCWTLDDQETAIIILQHARDA